jgi:hypothetical protein
MVWVLGMLVLQSLCPDQYAEVLEWSLGCWKDCLRLAHTAEAAGFPVGPEMALMATKLTDYVCAGRTDGDMLFKYVPAARRQFEHEHVALRDAFAAQLMARVAEWRDGMVAMCASLCLRACLPVRSSVESVHHQVYVLFI